MCQPLHVAINIQCSLPLCYGIVLQCETGFATEYIINTTSNAWHDLAHSNELCLPLQQELDDACLLYWVSL
jgi:hypothetical protein